MHRPVRRVLLLPTSDSKVHQTTGRKWDRNYDSGQKRYAFIISCKNQLVYACESFKMKNLAADMKLLLITKALRSRMYKYTQNDHDTQNVQEAPKDSFTVLMCPLTVYPISREWRILVYFANTLIERLAGAFCYPKKGDAMCYSTKIKRDTSNIGIFVYFAICTFCASCLFFAPDTKKG